MAAANIDGLWVTIPHKPALAALVDSCDAAVAVSGSVNAVRRNADGSLHGGLFDGTGFVQALRHFGFAPRGRSVLLLGAGGAGAAIAVALAEAGVDRIALHDLGDRAATLAGKLAGRLARPGSQRLVRTPLGFDLVVNATPLGLKPGDPLPVDVGRLDTRLHGGRHPDDGSADPIAPGMSGARHRRPSRVGDAGAAGTRLPRLLRLSRRRAIRARRP